MFFCWGWDEDKLISCFVLFCFVLVWMSDWDSFRLPPDNPTETNKICNPCPKKILCFTTRLPPFCTDSTIFCNRSWNLKKREPISKPIFQKIRGLVKMEGLKWHKVLFQDKPLHHNNHYNTVSDWPNKGHALLSNQSVDCSYIHTFVQNV